MSIKVLLDTENQQRVDGIKEIDGTKFYFRASSQGQRNARRSRCVKLKKGGVLEGLDVLALETFKDQIVKWENLSDQDGSPVPFNKEYIVPVWNGIAGNDESGNDIAKELVEFMDGLQPGKILEDADPQT